MDYAAINGIPSPHYLGMGGLAQGLNFVLCDIQGTSLHGYCPGLWEISFL